MVMMEQKEILAGGGRKLKGLGVDFRFRIHVLDLASPVTYNCREVPVSSPIRLKELLHDVSVILGD